MKKLIAMLLALVMILSLCACDKKNSTEEELETAYLLSEISATQTDSEGKTSTMKATMKYDDDYNLIGGETYQDGKLVYKSTFDKDPQKPLVELEYEDGKETSRTTYTYDANGNLLERSGNRNYNGKNSTFKYIFTYDANSNMLTEKNYSNGKLENEFIYTYTAFNKVATEILRYSYGEEVHCTYTYDQHENKISETRTWQYDNGETRSTQTTYENTYDGDKLAEVKTYEDGKLESWEKYDANGNETLRVYYYGDDGEESSRYESTYDEDGKILKRVDKWGGETNTTTYTYNSSGKIVETNYSAQDGRTSRSAYSYDDNGNVTGMKTYTDGKVTMEYKLNYKEVSVSKEVAEKIAVLVEKTGILGY